MCLTGSRIGLSGGACQHWPVKEVSKDQGPEEESHHQCMCLLGWVLC
jgi:hypothetical protein